jgi:hypothetical protein
MNTLVGKGLFRIARALRVTSYFVGALTALALVASPFVASSFGDWLQTAGTVVAVAVAAWLILFLGLPTLLARWAMAVLPDEQMDYARAELAIWAYEGHHGAANAELRQEFHAAMNASPTGRRSHMEFQTDAQGASYENVREWVKQLYGESAWFDPEMPRMSCPVGGFTIVVVIEGMGDDGACADIWTWPFDEDKPPDGVLRSMLEVNGRFRFGALNIQKDGTVVFEYVVQLDGLNKERFEALMYMVAGSASEIKAELTPKMAV